MSIFFWKLFLVLLFPGVAGLRLTGGQSHGAAFIVKLFSRLWHQGWETYCALPWWLSGKESTCQCRRHCFHPWVGKIPCRRKWEPIPVFLPGESHGQRRLAGCSPPGHKDSDTTERLTLSHFSLSDRTSLLPLLWSLTQHTAIVFANLSVCPWRLSTPRGQRPHRLWVIFSLQCLTDTWHR